MKITIHALHLGTGGVENYLITLANLLSLDNDVTIVSTYRVSENPAFLLSDLVNQVYLTDRKPEKLEFVNSLKGKQFIKSAQLLFSNVKLLIDKYYKNKKFIKEDDSELVITSRIFHNNLVSKYSKARVKIATEHNHHNNDFSYINKLSKSVRGFNTLVPISKELTKFYSQNERFTNINVLNIPFYIDEQSDFTSLEDPNYIYVGRLSKEKGVLDLIYCFYEVTKLAPSSILTIVGDGDMDTEMKLLVKELAIEKNVIFCGFMKKEDIELIMKRQSFMLLTSFTESFGIVLLEAMSFGVIPLVFDSAQGALEVLQGFDELIISNRSAIELAAKSQALYYSDKKIVLSKELIERSRCYNKEEMRRNWSKLIRSY